MRTLATLVLLLAAPADDSAEGARRLLETWESGAVGIERMRDDWARRRVERARLEIKLRAAKTESKRDALKKKAVALEAEIDALDAGLAERELAAVGTLREIGELRSAEAIRWIATDGLARAKAPVLRRALARAVARSKDAGPDAIVAALGSSKKPEMIVPLLQALAEHGASGEAVPAIAGYLRHREWTVRVAAAFALAETARPEGVEPVLVALKDADDGSRELRELAAALTRYTGQNHGPYPDVWWKWWKAEKLNVLEGRVPLGKGARAAKGTGEQGTFYGIPQEESRIIYVVDISGSMDVSMTNPRWIDNDPVPARDDEDSRFDAAMRELVRATRKLRPKTTYAVILYSSHVKPLHDKMLPATPENRAKTEKELAYTGPSGSTNIYAALDHALRLAGVHPDEKGGKQVADAIYLLSDGSPTDSKGKTEDPERTLLAAREWNALGKVAIHTIGIGRQHNRAFLQALADQNGGRYYAVGDRPKKRQ